MSQKLLEPDKKSTVQQKTTTKSGVDNKNPKQDRGYPKKLAMQANMGRWGTSLDPKISRYEILKSPFLTFPIEITPPKQGGLYKNY